jgi:hypothetical protein
MLFGLENVPPMVAQQMVSKTANFAAEYVARVTADHRSIGIR